MAIKKYIDEDWQLTQKLINQVIEHVNLLRTYAANDIHELKKKQDKREPSEG